MLNSALITAQDGNNINKIDKDGKKQGRWIKNYPDGNIMYEGFFRDNKPEGEFRRYYEDKNLKSIMVYTNNGAEANATIYYPNGYIAAKGKYVNQEKEGKWQFFSALNNGTLISEEEYLNGKKHGVCLKFYPDSTIAEKVCYSNDIENGEYLRYHEDGSLNFKSNYLDGKLEGTFEAFYENGNPEFTGHYKQDLKDGIWRIYKEDGSLRFEIEYIEGRAVNHELDIYETEYIESLEKNKLKINDPEKTGKYGNP